MAARGSSLRSDENTRALDASCGKPKAPVNIMYYNQLGLSYFEFVSLISTCTKILNSLYNCVPHI